jgi:hypothetical protein
MTHFSSDVNFPIYYCTVIFIYLFIFYLSSGEEGAAGAGGEV